MRHRLSLGLWGARLLTVLFLLVTLVALWGTARAGAPPAAADQPPAAGPSQGDTMGAGMLVASLFILVLAGFVGFEVIGGVSPLLHTPLMSVTNAISAISLVGSLVIAGSKEYPDTLSRVLGFIAVTAAMINVVGGFMITDRMLRMFKPKEKAA
jgi:H+-translocating NAD(P) transhydrogenase subunit alpha